VGKRIRLNECLKHDKRGWLDYWLIGGCRSGISLLYLNLWRTAINDELEEGVIVIEVPFQIRRRGGRKEVIIPDDIPPEPTQLQLALARAFRWQKMLDEGKVESVQKLAEDVGMDKTKVARMLRMTLLAPDIVDAILDGTEPEGTTIIQLYEAIPVLWEEQRRLYGLPTVAR
jgi:hypothetical protein